MRNTDRYVTPAVVVTGLLVAGGIVALLIGAVFLLQREGVDPDPMLRLIGEVVTAVSALGTLALTLANRATVAKTERNAGVAMTAAQAVNAKVDHALWVDTGQGPLPPVPARHAADPPTGYINGAAPAPQGR